MIDNVTIEKIQRLLQTSMSQRQIATIVGVSRGTVQAVAKGKRQPHENRPQAPQYFWTAPFGVPKRCPKCGALAVTPCLACQIYELEQKKQNANGFDVRETIRKDNTSYDQHFR